MRWPAISLAPFASLPAPQAPQIDHAPSRGELPIIQATMDLIQWFVPLLNRLPRVYRFAPGDRLVKGLLMHGLYNLLEGLVVARHAATGSAQQ